MGIGEMEGATIAATPEGRRRAAADSQVVLAASTARVLSTDEAARALAFARALVALTAAGVVALPFLYNPARPLYWPMAAIIVGLFAGSTWMWWRARHEAGHSPRAFRVFIALAMMAGLFVVYDLGVFSPAPLFVTLGIVFLAQSMDRTLALWGTGFAATSYLVLALLVSFGVIHDAGLFPADSGPRAARVLFALMVPVAYVVAFWQGRLSRRATLRAIEKSHEALRLALTREAQLAEAHQDLDQALRAGAGKSGRHSGAVMGKYRLSEIIGRGAMGEIYAAAHVDTAQPAAVKVLQDSVSSDPDLVERFLREGRIAGCLKAPNVVSVYDVGAAGGVQFIAMELLVGEDLAALLRRRERLDLPAVLDLVDQVARGLEAARVAGVVHRDLKPQNVFHVEMGEGKPQVTLGETPKPPAQPVWKILDFGVSKLRDASATLTRSAVIGTPGYMSPEQAEGRDADHRSDVFALGAVAYRALTGRPPFTGEIPQVLFEIAYKSPVCPSDLVPSLPPDVDLVLALCLAKRADDRFDGALEVAAALREAASGHLSPARRARALALLESAPWGSALRAA